MSQLNPFIGAILPAAQAQRQQAAERTEQVRRTQDLKKNAAAQRGDMFEHQVESSDAINAVNDQDARQDGRKKRGTRKQLTSNSAPAEPGNLDLTA